MKTWLKKHWFKIDVTVLFGFTLFSIYNASKPFFGISLWESKPEIWQAYGSGMLMMFPVFLGVTALIGIMIKEAQK